jgi:hypothetical protein
LRQTEGSAFARICLAAGSGFFAAHLRRRNLPAHGFASAVPEYAYASATLNDKELRKSFRRKNTARKSFLGHARWLNDLPIEAAIVRPTQDSLPIGGSSSAHLPQSNSRTHNVAVAARPDLKTHLDIIVEFDQHGDQPFDGEALKLRLPYARKIGCSESGQLVRAADADAEIIQHADDLRSENCFRVQDIRIGMAEIAEHISTPPHQFQIVFGHRNIFLQPLEPSHGSGKKIAKQRMPPLLALSYAGV